MMYLHTPPSPSLLYNCNIMSLIAIMMTLLMVLRKIQVEASTTGFVSSSKHLLRIRCKSSILTAPISTPPTSWEMITNNQSSKTVKLFKSIHKNKAKRNESGLTIAEGVRLVTDILSDEKTRRLVRRIIVSESLLNEQGGNEYQQKLQHWLNVVEMESRQSKAAFALGNNNENVIDPVTINIGTKQVLSACSGTVSTQGVVALMDIPKYQDSSSIVAKNASENNKPPFYVILDGLQDPGNVGTILRSCAASHVSALVLLPDSCDVWNPKAVRSAMGASFRVPVIELNERNGALKNAIDMLCESGIGSNRVFAATMEDTGDGRSSIAHYNIDFNGGAAIILGKEGEGLREEVRNAMGQGLISSVHIPMAEGTESLNAAVCGSIIMFERMRQLSAIQSTSTYELN